MESFDIINSSESTYDELLSQFETIGQLDDKHHELTIDPKTQRLTLSSKPTFWFQGLFSSHNTTWSTMATKIDALIAKATLFFESEYHQISITKKDIQTLKMMIEKSQLSLEKIGEKVAKYTKNFPCFVAKIHHLIHTTQHQPEPSHDCQASFHDDKEKPWIDNYFAVSAQPLPKTTNIVQNSSLMENYFEKSDQKEDLIIDETTYIHVEESMEILKKEVKMINHPLVDIETVKKFATELNGISNLVIGNDDVERRAKINKLQEILKKINPAQQNTDNEWMLQQKLVSHLVLLALYPLTLKNGACYFPLSFDKIKACLKQLDQPLSTRIDPRFFQNDAIRVEQKLYLLSQMNLPFSLVKSINQSPLHQEMYQSFHLSDFLLGHQVHVPQLYRQTCISTAFNHYFQKRLPTIVEMIEIAQRSIAYVTEKLENLSKDVLEEAAYTVKNGSAPTKQEYGKMLLDQIKTNFDVLATQGKETLFDNKISPEKIANLTIKWNFLMQQIAMLLDPANPKVFHYQYFPNNYKVSAVLAEFIGRVKLLVSNGPDSSQYWRSIYRSDLATLGKKMFAFNDIQMIFRNPFQDPSIGPLLKNISIDQIWEHVSHNNGAMIDQMPLELGDTGHSFYAEASFHKKNGVDEQVFILYDSMSDRAKRYSLEEFATFLNQKDTSSCMYTFDCS